MHIDTIALALQEPDRATVMLREGSGKSSNHLTLNLSRTETSQMVAEFALQLSPTRCAPETASCAARVPQAGACSRPGPARPESAQSSSPDRPCGSNQAKKSTQAGTRSKSGATVAATPARGARATATSPATARVSERGLRLRWRGEGWVRSSCVHLGPQDDVGQSRVRSALQRSRELWRVVSLDRKSVV